MTPEQILDLAGELDKHKHWNDDGSNRLVTFAKLIEAHTREECAKVCEHLHDSIDIWKPLDAVTPINVQCAQAIRSMQT